MSELPLPVRSILVLEQAGWHTRNHIRAPDELNLVFLLPYSPELQPAERPRMLSNDHLQSHVYSKPVKPPSLERVRMQGRALALATACFLVNYLGYEAQAEAVSPSRVIGLHRGSPLLYP